MLRLPKGTAASSSPRNLAKIAPQERLTFQVHQVKRGDTLSVIAARYRSAPEAIMQINGLRNARGLRLNTELVDPGAGPPRRGAARSTRRWTRQVAQARRSGFVAAPPGGGGPRGHADERRSPPAR